MWGIRAKHVFLLFVHVWEKHGFVVLSRTAGMICHYLKRIVCHLVLCKQLKTVFVTGDTGLAVLPMKIPFF